MQAPDACTEWLHSTTISASLIATMTDQPPPPSFIYLVPAIRDASRQLVRELGFMRNTLAGTDLSPSSVHTILEIGEQKTLIASDLSQVLNLEKSSVSRMLKKLVEAGEIAEKVSNHDGREKTLLLTAKATRTLAKINQFAQWQVAEALENIHYESCRAIRDGILLYAGALRARRVKPPSLQADNTMTIVSGYQPGILARAIDMHMLYYSRTVGFGRAFEHSLASGLGDLLSRLDHPGNGVWAAMEGNRIVGTIFIDGQDLGANKAHLRAFIVDDHVRGSGVGRRLLDQAMGFVDIRGFEETHLWTFKGLDAARTLYERVGFGLAKEAPGRRWGEETVVQLFVRKCTSR